VGISIGRGRIGRVWCGVGKCEVYFIHGTSNLGERGQV